MSYDGAYCPGCKEFTGFGFTAKQHSVLRGEVAFKGKTGVWEVKFAWICLERKKEKAHCPTCTCTKV